MKVNPVFVALNVMFLVLTVGVLAQHGGGWWAIPFSLWAAYVLFASTGGSR